MKIAFIGFSEAGPGFASVMVRHGATVTAFDLRSLDPDTAGNQRAVTARVGAVHSGSMAAAVSGAELVISTVTASAALPVAQQAAPLLTPEQWYFDLNSIAPATKLAVRDALAPSKATFVEGVAMGRITEGLLPPVLLSGPQAPALAGRLSALGMEAFVASTAWGAAPAAKLLRSVVVKGIEAVLSEAFEAAARADAVDPLLRTLSDWMPTTDWQGFTGYHLGRMAAHGQRRAAELRECAALLETLGTAAPTTRGAAARQDDIGARNLLAAGDLEAWLKEAVGTGTASG